MKELQGTLSQVARKNGGLTYSQVKLFYTKPTTPAMINRACR